MSVIKFYKLSNVNYKLIFFYDFRKIQKNKSQQILMMIYQTIYQNGLAVRKRQIMKITNK